MSSEVNLASAIDKATQIAKFVVGVGAVLVALVDTAEKTFAMVTEKTGGLKKDMVASAVAEMLPDSLKDDWNLISGAIGKMINFISKWRHGSSGNDPDPKTQTTQTITQS
jgi:hypothetical protein